MAFLLPAFVACLILTGIHAYLGMHVIARGVIFVDIALAQIAALGFAIASLLGYDHGSFGSYLLALGLTVVASVFFAFAKDKKIPQEAMIGVTFAFSSALALLVSSFSPHGMEQVEQTLNGNLLWVNWDEIIKIAIIYSAIGALHFIFRKPLLKMSFTHESSIKKSWKWDLLFYVSFGVIITSSVQVAGILVVFSYLIVPALVSLFFFDTIAKRLGFAWIYGVIVTTLGLALSFGFDLPSGATIVVLMGGSLFLFFIGFKILCKGNS